jgi:hypothetical protein
LGSFHNFNFYWQWANQIGSLQKKLKKMDLGDTPQLINMKQNISNPGIYNGGISPGQKW